MDFVALKAGKTTVASGLRWRTDIEPKAALETARVADAGGFVPFRNGLGFACGLLPAENRGDYRGTAYALAALLAGVPAIAKNALFILEDETDGTALLACLRDGLPAPGYDGFGPIDEIRGRAEEFLSLVPGEVSCYGSSAAFACAPLSLETIAKTSATRRLARIRALPKGKPLALLLLAVLLLAAGAGYQYHEQGKAKLRAALAAAAQIDDATLYRQSLDEALGSLLPAKPVLAQLREKLGAQVAFQGGWALASVKCGPEACQYEWKSHGGSTRSFEPPAGAQAVTIAYNGESIGYLETLQVQAARGLGREALPSVNAMLTRHLGAIQELREFGVALKLSTPEPFAVPMGLGSMPEPVVKAAAFELTGPFWALDAVAELPDTVSFDAFELQHDGNFNLIFALKGKYYVQ